MRKKAVVSCSALVVSLSLLFAPAVAQEQPREPGPVYAQPVSPQPAGAFGIPDEPPPVGELVLEDPLTGPGAFSTGRCPMQNLHEFVGEGFILKVTGKCRETSDLARIDTLPIQVLTVPDGEVRLEAKVVSGHDRAAVRISIRYQGDPGGLYRLAVTPALGRASLANVTGSEVVILAARADLAGRLARDDWNDLAVRVQGPNLWVLLNDELILSAADPTYASGTVFVGLLRLGDVNDNQESAVVLRNLRVSNLAT